MFYDIKDSNLKIKRDNNIVSINLNLSGDETISDFKNSSSINDKVDILGKNFGSFENLILKDVDVDLDSKDFLLYYNEFIEVVKFEVKDNYRYTNNSDSVCILVSLEIDIKFNDIQILMNHPYLLETNSSVKLSGNGYILIIRIPKYLVGLDVGGTNIKGMVIDDIGHIISNYKSPTQADNGYDVILNNMKKVSDKVIEDSKLNSLVFKSIGVGFPGNIDSKKGIVRYSNNINIEEKEVSKDFYNLTGLITIIDNDANCACLGEYMFTSKKKYHDMCLITLGTGVGSGFIIDSKLFKGGMGSVTEVGHMKVKTDKVMCTCGQYGCLESLLSLKRIKDDVNVLLDGENNGLKELLKESDSPQRIFEFSEINEAAKSFAFKYQNNLLLGLINICNLFQPECIVIGGGISYCISKYIESLEYRMNKYKYSGFRAPKVKLVQAKLGNDAGCFGACALTL